MRESSPAYGVRQPRPREFGCVLRPTTAAPTIVEAQSFDDWRLSLCYLINLEHLGKMVKMCTHGGGISVDPRTLGGRLNEPRVYQG